MDPQINQPNNTPTDPGASPGPAPTAPNPLYNEPTTVAMNSPAVPVEPVQSPVSGAASQPVMPAQMPSQMPAGGAMPNATQPPAEKGKGLPMPLLIVAAVVLIGVVLALVLL